MEEREEIGLGDRIRYYRKRCGLTKTQLAEIANVSLPTVIKYENNDVEHPDYNILLAFSMIFGVTINKLIMGIESPDRGEEPEALIK